MGRWLRRAQELEAQRAHAPDITDDADVPQPSVTASLEPTEGGLIGRWLRRAQELEAQRAHAPGTPDQPDDANLPLPVAATSAADPTTDDRDDAADPEMSWRVVAFRAVIPAHGPIWPPRVRETPLTDTPGHCTLCGDVLPTDRAPQFPRCAPCVRALSQVLHETREEVTQ
jgi:hypothetical protein